MEDVQNITERKEDIVFTLRTITMIFSRYLTRCTAPGFDPEQVFSTCPPRLTWCSVFYTFRLILNISDCPPHSVPAQCLSQSCVLLCITDFNDVAWKPVLSSGFSSAGRCSVTAALAHTFHSSQFRSLLLIQKLLLVCDDSRVLGESVSVVHLVGGIEAADSLEQTIRST